MPDQTPKLKLPKPLGNENVNRQSYNALIDAIEANAAKDSQTINQDISTPYSNTGLLSTILSWFAKVIKGITGKTNWYDAPATTLEAAKGHMDDVVRHVTQTDKNNWNSKQNALGYTPVNRAGDTMSGPLTVNDQIKPAKQLAPNFGVKPTKDDVKFLFYDNGGENWAGIGVHTDGSLYLKTGSGNGFILFDKDGLQKNIFHEGNVPKTRINNGQLEFWDGSWKGAGGVKSIQRGIASAATQTADTITIPIATVNPDKCEVILNGSWGQGNASSDFSIFALPYLFSLTANTLTIKRSGTDGGTILNMSWQVIEHA